MAPNRKPKSENLSQKGGQSKSSMKTGTFSTPAPAERNKFPSGNIKLRERPPPFEGYRQVKRLDLSPKTRSKFESSSSGSSSQELKGQPSTNGFRGRAGESVKRVARSKRQIAPTAVVSPLTKRKRITDTGVGVSNGQARVLNRRYRVERILDKKVEHGNKFYLVKWKNYKPSRNTWEPLCHFSSEFIRQWEERRRRNQTRSSGRPPNPPMPPTNAAGVSDGQAAGPSRGYPGTESSGNGRVAAFTEGDSRPTDSDSDSSGQETEAVDEFSNDSDDSFESALTALFLIK